LDATQFCERRGPRRCVCLAFAASFLFNLPSQAYEPPAVSIIVPKEQFKLYAGIIDAAAKEAFKGLSIEVKVGVSEKIASESVGLILRFTGYEVIDEQRFDQFVKGRTYNGIPIASGRVDSWKKVAVKMDDVPSVPGENVRRKPPQTSVGIAGGKVGTFFNLKLDDNATALLASATLDAAMDWQVEVLRSIIACEQPGGDNLTKIRNRLTVEDGTHVFEARRTRVAQRKLTAEFDMNNTSPFAVDIEARYFVLIKDDKSWVPLREDLGTAKMLSIEPGQVSTEKLEPYALNPGRTAMGIYMSAKVIKFRMPVK
jgi:hypothetical protein